MYSKILVPVDPGLGDVAHRAVDAARALLDPAGEIELLTVFQDVPPYYGTVIDAGGLGQQEQRLRGLLAEQFGAPDVKTRVATGHAGRTILDVASEDGHDCIVIASHQPGWGRVFFGSTAATVVRHARCSVHVLRTPE